MTITFIEPAAIAARWGRGDVCHLLDRNGGSLCGQRPTGAPHWRVGLADLSADRDGVWTRCSDCDRLAGWLSG